MKKHILALLSISALTACNDDFLERTPIGSPTEKTAFVNYDNFKAYAWGLYSTFPVPGYGGENATDDISYNQSVTNSESAWIRGTVTVPDSYSGTAWSYYSYIRSVNLMLDHIDSSNMSEVEREHWRSVGYFFRAYRYFSLLNAYGGVPWVDHVLSDNENDLVFGPRVSRDEIAEHILTDLKHAETHIKPDGDGKNTINKHTVQALLSRFTLFEGTWRKYHGLDHSDKYLKECKRVSYELIQDYPNIADCYDDLFCSIDLGNVPGIILYRQYDNALNVVHAISIGGTTAQSFYNPTRDLVDSYLCSDGKPRWTSPLFLGDEDQYDEFSNRDHRMWLHITPPYEVDRSASTSAWDNKWTYTTDPKDRSFIDSLATRMGLGLGTTKERQKTLPFRQGFEGGILGASPHFGFHNLGQPWYVSNFGYNNWKYFCTYLAQGAQRNEETDMPIFRIEETMLNYAEAMCELNEFDQSIADITINKLRIRANVAPMNVSEVDDSFDPHRDLGNPSYPNDYEVNPLLWEIRRERRIELFSEGFRFDDLRRWKKCSYSMKKKLGQFVRRSDFPAGTNVRIHNGAEQGYLEFHPEQTHLWPEHYYLNAIPRNERVLNRELSQNDGWDDGL